MMKILHKITSYGLDYALGVCLVLFVATCGGNQ